MMFFLLFAVGIFDTISSFKITLITVMLHKCKQVLPFICAKFVPLELEGAKLPLCKVAVWHLLTPRGRIVHSARI